MTHIGFEMLKWIVMYLGVGTLVWIVTCYFEYRLNKWFDSGSFTDGNGSWIGTSTLWPFVVLFLTCLIVKSMHDKFLYHCRDRTNNFTESESVNDIPKTTNTRNSKT